MLLCGSSYSRRCVLSTYFVQSSVLGTRDVAVATADGVSASEYFNQNFLENSVQGAVGSTKNSISLRGQGCFQQMEVLSARTVPVHAHGALLQAPVTCLRAFSWPVHTAGLSCQGTSGPGSSQ